jgi:hypothetical protein
MKVCGECIHWYGHAYLLNAISIGVVACGRCAVRWNLF